MQIRTPKGDIMRRQYTGFLTILGIILSVIGTALYLMPKYEVEMTCDDHKIVRVLDASTGEEVHLSEAEMKGLRFDNPTCVQPKQEVFR